MPSYKITVNIPDAKTRLDLARGKYFLTMATGFSSDDEVHFNIGAFVVEDMAPHIEISWKDEFALDATKTEYKPGSAISVSSDLLEVEFGNGYFLEAWSDEARVKTDRSAPKNGFSFNNGMFASSVVSQKISGEWRPVFICPAPLQPGVQTIVPLPKARLWFQNKFVTPTMVAHDVSRSFTVDLSHKHHATLSYNEKDGWSHD